MKRWILAVAATAFLLAAPAYAGHQLPHNQPFAAMTLNQLEQYQARSLSFHETVVRRWTSSPERLAALRLLRVLNTDARFVLPKSPYCGPLDARAPADVCWHAHAIVWARAELARTRAALNPPIAHLALWRCIAGYPGARPGGDSGESGGNPAASNGSHFNILQMTNPWAGIDPIGMSPTAIMELAEQQYADSGYSHIWLGGQWGQTIGPCWEFS